MSHFVRHLPNPLGDRLSVRLKNLVEARLDARLDQVSARVVYVIADTFALEDAHQQQITPTEFHPWD